MTMESTAGWRSQFVAGARSRKLYHHGDLLHVGLEADAK